MIQLILSTVTQVIFSCYRKEYVLQQNGLYSTGTTFLPLSSNEGHLVDVGRLRNGIESVEGLQGQLVGHVAPRGKPAVTS